MRPGKAHPNEELREWLRNAEDKVWRITEELDGVAFYIRPSRQLDAVMSFSRVNGV